MCTDEPDGTRFGPTVLTTGGGQVREVAVFGVDLYPLFDLPATLDPGRAALPGRPTLVL